MDFPARTPHESHPIRLGLIGLGWGQQVAEAIAAIPDVSLVTCYARTPESRARFAARYGCRPCASYEEMLSDPTIDAIVVMTPNSCHREHTLMAAARRKHVLVTKPIANALEAGKDMIRACAQHGVLLAVSHPSRREAGIRRLKSLLNSGELGLIGLVEANCATTTGLSSNMKDWRHSESEAPGGPLLQLGIHQIDNLHYLLGPIARVHCISRRVSAHASVDEVLCCLLEFESGLTGTLTCSYVSSESRWIRLYGANANAYYDRMAGLTIIRDIWNVGLKRERLTDGLDMSAPIPTLQEEIAAFADCIRNNTSPEVGGAEGLRALAVVLAAVESSRTGRAVDVNALLQQA